MMPEACERALEALKVLLTDPNNYNPFCLGTSEMFWRRIKEEGLQPVVCSMSGQCTDSTYEDVGNRVLDRTWIGRAGHKLCSVYARRAVKRSAGDPLNITFNTRLTTDGMRPSKEYVESDGFDPNNPSIEDVPNAPTLMREAQSACSPEAIKDLLKKLPDWSKSLIAKKSANFISMIRVEPISIENVNVTEPLSEQWND